MRSASTKALLAANLVALICAPVLGQATVYNWIATDAVADWNVEANWDSVFGNAVPNADAFAGETALINNARTALADATVPKVAALEVRNGTLEIPAGGTVETIADDLATGGLIVAASGAVRLSGDGKLIIEGDAANAGTIRLSGADASISIGGDFSTNGTLAAGITGDSHGTISVAGVASLGGRLQVDISGTTPTFGQSWDLVNAASISGRFVAVDAGGSAALPRGLQYQVTTDDSTASLQLGNALIASVDRQTGAGTIENAVGAPIEITSYALRSNNGLLAAGFPGALGEGWTSANPTENHVAELNLTGSLNLDVGATIDLGNPYAGGPARPAEEDLVFQYTTADGNLREGIVEYTGALNDLVLHIDPADGSAAIANLSRFIAAPDLTSYAVRSESGGLTVGTWTSFADSGLGGDGWTIANPTSNHIAELNLESSKSFTNGTLLSLGEILATDASQDLVFEYTTTAGELLRGSIQYGPIPTPGGTPGDCNGDGQVNAADLGCVSDTAQRDLVLTALNTLAGDLDGDGSVAFPDFLTLSTNFNDPTKTRYVDGNIDLQNGVAFADFLVLSTNFNKTPETVAAAVPEPGALGLFLVAALAVSVRRRRCSTGW